MNKELAISILRGDVLGTNEQTHEAVFMAIKALKAEPVRHGKWIKSEKSDFEWECSECGYGLTDYKLTYCYDCGAKMDLKEVEK
ncbi:MAG: hypothetical protein II453_11400 [Alphaproteobacteria bacterium]|nr:hypothetical protein [Alphaproteobacteria bacterium]